MDPYRGPRAVEALPPLPLDGVLRPLLGIAGAALAVGTVVLLLGAGGATPTPRAPLVSPPAQDIDLRRGDLDALGAGVVVVTGVVRERRQDTFGESYVELGKGTGWERQIVQCYFSGASVWTPPRGALARFRGQFVGRSLAVAVQLEDCVLVADLGDAHEGF